jgi:single-stranded-DNA-specific exonuclease
MRRHLRHLRSLWWREKRAWEVAKIEVADAQRLSQQLRISALLAKVLCARGFTMPQEARTFLLGTGKDLPDPKILPGVSEAALILSEAIKSGTPILVHGDYDADGISATALLATTIAKLGGKVAWFVPNRLQDGYGVSTRAVQMAKQKRHKTANHFGLRHNCDGSN